MARRDRRHDPRRRRRGGRWGRGLALVLVLALVAGIAATYRYDLADRWFPRRADGPVDPAAVAPPPGLDLPALTEPAPVAAPVVAGAIDKQAVRAALAPYLADRDLGRHVLAAVSGLDGGPSYTFDRGGSGTAIPASTTKLLTATAALATIDPATTFATRVVRTGTRVTLVGGGDPLLASAPADPAEADGVDRPARADLTTLARQAATALLADGVTSVRLRYDDTLFTGPAVNPHWPASYQPDGVVAPISALWADEGRPASGTGRVADPARAAAEVFARELAAAGVAVAGAPVAKAAPADADAVAEVRSAPLDQLVAHALLVSDNEATEVLLRQVALAGGAEGSTAAGVRTVLGALSELGVPTDDVRLWDGSGLSRENRIPPATLLGVLRAAATGAADLRTVVAALPVAGFTGSLSERFADAPAAGPGRVRAKTGTLTGVSSLAGVATTVEGTPLLFVLMTDQVAEVNTLEARDALDSAAAALAACACAGTVVP